MRNCVVVFTALSFIMAGCGRTQAPRQEAQINSDALSVDGADMLLSQPAQSAPGTPAAPAADIVVNQDAAPLVGPAVPAKSVATVSVTDSPDGKMIQQALKNLGLYSGAIDGKIGPKTKEAIKAFQERHNLQVDAKVGPKTWALLKSALENPASN